nr:echinoderm microtubule-associated protein-like 5 [Cherax quadricarinatus]
MMGSRQLPDGCLELAWVFGYNGQAASNNVKVNKDGHLVYHVAALGVVHDVTNTKQSFYTGHNNDITSWQCNSKSSCSTISTLVEAVVAHVLQLLLVPVKYPYLYMPFPLSHSLTRTQGGVLVTEVYPGGLLSGGTDGNVTLFDKQLNKVSTVSGAPSLVYGVAGPIHSLTVFREKLIIGTEKNEVWMGSVEGGVGAATCVVQGHSLGEAWGLATHPTKPVAVTASDDRTVRLWELDERRPLATTVLEKAVRAAAFSPDGQHVAVGLTHGTFVIFQAEQLKEEHRISDRKEVRHDLKYSPCGAFLAVASNDNFVDIYKVEPGYERCHVLQGASSFITHLDWSTDSCYLQLNSGARERLIFQVEKESVVGDSSITEVEWSSWTCVLGAQVAGIWPKYSDTSDVNACHANMDLGVIVTAGDDGFLRLFRFPCAKKDSKSESYVGHSEHVSNVRWSCDSRYVVSVGGGDHALCLWKLKSPPYTSTHPQQTVKLPSALGKPEQEALDTDGDLKTIPQPTQNLPDDLPGNTAISRQRGKNKNRDSSALGVKIAEDSTFAKRRNAKSGKSQENTQPEHSLHLHHVFGVRVHECRNNAHWLKNRQVVYHIAAIGVVCDPNTTVQRHYLQHTDDILCLDVHPGGEFVASGQVGREATVHVWDAREVCMISLLEGGHTVGVVSVNFSGDGDLLASLGLDDYHTVVLWNWHKGYKLASARGHSDKVFGVRFSPSDNNHLVTYGVKHVKFWTQTEGSLTYNQLVLGQQFKQNTVLCSSVGGGKGDTEWWLLGLSSGDVLVVRDAKVERTIKAHKGPIYTILVTHESVWIAGQCGYVSKWDTEMKECVKVFPVTDHLLEDTSTVSLNSSQPGLRSLSAAPLTVMPILVATHHAELLFMDADGKFTVLVQGHSKGEVWGLDTHPSLMEAVTVGGDNTLRCWNLEGHALGSATLRKTARCLHFHPSGLFLVLGYLDGSVALYQYPSLEKQGAIHHRSEGISDIRFSPDGCFLAVGSHECLVDIYAVNISEDDTSKEGSSLHRVGQCQGASSWITHLTWHKDSKLLQINTGAGEQLFYEAPHGTHQLIPENTNTELAWASPLTCPLDATVEGVWAPHMDLTDINAVATAHNLPLVATASDDQGLVSLFRYPCQGEQKCRQYGGHSAHVTNVRWTYDDSKLVTTGGGDTSVIVWALTLRDPPTSPHLQNDAQAINGLPNEDMTLLDVESAGLDDDIVVRAATTRESKASKTGKTQAVQHGSNFATHLRSMPTLTPDDKMVFYCSGSIVGRLNVAEGGEVEGQNVGHGDHKSFVTALTVSPAEPVMVATAQLGMAEDTQEDKAEFALVHVWSASDGSTAAVLRGGPEALITSLTFSPSGRFLASLADASIVHVFNWIKGVHIGHIELKAGMVTTMAHSSETTLTVLTPRTVLFLDLVGNSLVTTRGHVTPDLLPRDVAFNGLGVSPDGHVYVGCNDGSIVEWKGRTATRRVAPPDDSEIITPVRMSIAVGQGAIFTACRLDSVIVVRCYTTDSDELRFFSDSHITAPTGNWTPISARLGAALLVLGSRKNHPFIILDLKSGKFTLIEHV